MNRRIYRASVAAWGYLCFLACSGEPRLVGMNPIVIAIPMGPPTASIEPGSDAGAVPPPGDLGPLRSDGYPVGVSVPCATFRGIGEPDSVVTDISASGDVAVGYLRRAPAYRAFRWPLSGDLIELGDRSDAGSTDAQAAGISGDGRVIVGAWSRLGGVTAYRWTVSDGYVGLASAREAIDNVSTTAFRTNFDGSVTVGYASDGSQDRAARWVGSGVAVYLSDADAGRAQATAVNADGSVIVGVSNQRAVRWSDASGTELLDGYPADVGTPASSALGVSADGEIVVGASNSNAFRWTRLGGMQQLEGMPIAEGATSVATAISADGRVVVGRRCSSGGDQAFSWMADPSNSPGPYRQGLHDIKALLPAEAAANWRLTEASAVSRDGSVIVGVGENPSRQAEAWVVKLPASCP